MKLGVWVEENGDGLLVPVHRKAALLWMAKQLLKSVVRDFCGQTTYIGALSVQYLIMV